MIRDITIKPVLNGFVAIVGCQSLVFTSVEALVTSLGEYLKEPDKKEELFKTSSLNSHHVFQGPVAPYPACDEAPRAAYPGSIQESTGGALVQRVLR